MKAALLTEPYHVELVDRDISAPGPGQARMRVEQCGLCTSEIDLWIGKAPDRLPAAIGHEVAGTIEEVGADVRNVKVGERVAAWVEGGGFAEQMIVEERYCVPVADAAAYPAVAEPLACVVNSVELAAPRLGDDIVIVGAGYMGNLLGLVSKLKGPRSITVVDKRPDALRRALALGANHVIDSSTQEVTAAVHEITDGRGADLTYEVTGVNPGLELAGTITRMSGKICIVGYHQGGERSIPLGRWNWMAFQVVNAHFRSIETIMAGMHTGMRLVNSGVLDVSPLMSDVYGLADIAQAFEAATSKPDGFVKAVIKPTV